MPDERLTNDAAERIRDIYGVWNEFSEPPSVAPADHFTDDFVFSDRRKGGVNFGELDASDYVRTFEQFWNVGGQPHFSMVEVIAVRGEWSTAHLERIVYGDSDMYTEFIIVVDRDPVRGRLRRIVHFDPEDVDAAIAELDRIHTENADESDPDPS
jgi:hypothetical protein